MELGAIRTQRNGCLHSFKINLPAPYLFRTRGRRQVIVLHEIIILLKRPSFLCSGILYQECSSLVRMMSEFVAFVVTGKINFLIFTFFFSFNPLMILFHSYIQYTSYFKKLMSDNLKILKQVIIYTHKDLKILLQNFLDKFFLYLFLLFLVIVFIIWYSLITILNISCYSFINIRDHF